MLTGGSEATGAYVVVPLELQGEGASAGSATRSDHHVGNNELLYASLLLRLYARVGSDGVSASWSKKARRCVRTTLGITYGYYRLGALSLS